MILADTPLRIGIDQETIDFDGPIFQLQSKFIGLQSYPNNLFVFM